MTDKTLESSRKVRDELTAEVKALSTPRQIAFLCCCCERLAPNYRAYCIDEGVGAAELLDRSLDLLWGIVRGKKFAKKTVRTLLEEIAASPVDEDRRSSFLGLAQDALSAVMFTLEFVLDNSDSRIREVIRWCDETVSEWIAMTSGFDPFHPGDDIVELAEVPFKSLKAANSAYLQWICDHPMARAERRWRRDNVAELSRMQTAAGSATWHALRQRARRVGIQPFIRALGPIRSNGQTHYGDTLL